MGGDKMPLGRDSGRPVPLYSLRICPKLSTFRAFRNYSSTNHREKIGQESFPSGMCQLVSQPLYQMPTPLSVSWFLIYNSILFKQLQLLPSMQHFGTCWCSELPDLWDHFQTSCSPTIIFNPLLHMLNYIQYACTSSYRDPSTFPLSSHLLHSQPSIFSLDSNIHFVGDSPGNIFKSLFLLLKLLEENLDLGWI